MKQLKQKFLNDAGVSSGDKTGLTNSDKYVKGTFIGRIKTPRSAKAKVVKTTVKSGSGFFNPSSSSASPWLRGNK